MTKEWLMDKATAVVVGADHIAQLGQGVLYAPQIGKLSG